MIRRFDRGVSLGDLAIGSNQNRHAARILRIRIGDPKRHRGCFRSIAEQVVGKVEFVPKLLIVIGRIEADSQYGGVSFFEVLDSITESFSFDGSPRRIGLGIPPEKDVAAREVVRLHGCTVLIAQLKAGRRCSDIDQGHDSSLFEDKRSADGSIIDAARQRDARRFGGQY